MAAKTRVNFIEEGRKSARMGNTRRPGGDWFMPVFGTGTSWQAKAFAEGFNEEKAAIELAEGNMTFERVSPAQHGRNMAEAGRGPSAKDYEGAVSHGASAVMADEFEARAEAAGVLPSQEEADHYAKSEYMPLATMEHVRQLRLRANSSPTNLALHARLHNKANALEQKHLTRFLARG